MKRGVPTGCKGTAGPSVPAVDPDSRAHDPADLPPATLANLLPPNLDYDYFTLAGRHPFLAAARRFSLSNAWWLTELSLLAYAPPEFSKPVLSAAGFGAVEFFNAQHVDCLVAADDACVLVAFRGTEIADWRDLVTDLRVSLVPHGHGGRVHAGCVEALDLLWQSGFGNELQRIQRSAAKERRMWFAGHSLGAALATLAAARIGDRASLYTFGSPRVGDRGFRDAFRPACWRVVNNNDAIVRLPPDPPYTHVGRLTYLDRHGHVHRHTSRWQRTKDQLLGNLTHLTEVAERLAAGTVGEVLDDNFVDHAPIYYATRLRRKLSQAPA